RSLARIDEVTTGQFGEPQTKPLSRSRVSGAVEQFDAPPTVETSGSLAIGGDEDDESTRLQDPNPRVLATMRTDPALEAEFRVVFQEFLETKHRCGESIDGITFDKFS